MTSIQERQSTDLREVLSLSIDAGVELERSAKKKSSRNSVIHKLGHVLLKNSSRQFTDGRRGFSDPSYVAPLSNVYVAQNKDDHHPEMDKVLEYWADRAAEFVEFDDGWTDERKKRLATICIQLHQYLSESLADRAKGRGFGRLH